MRTVRRFVHLSFPNSPFPRIATGFNGVLKFLWRGTKSYRSRCAGDISPHRLPTGREKEEFFASGKRDGRRQALGCTSRVMFLDVSVQPRSTNDSKLSPSNVTIGLYAFTVDLYTGKTVSNILGDGVSSANCESPRILEYFSKTAREKRW